MTSWPVVLALCSGCSFTLTGPDAHRPRAKAPECTTGKGAVLADGIFASIAGMGALGLGSENTAGVLVPLAIAGLFVGAAIHGNNVVNDCRKANDDYLVALNDAKQAPPKDDVDDEGPPGAHPAPAPAPAPAPVVAQRPVEQPEPVAEPAPQPQPAPQPAPVSAEAWATFWKEVR